MVFNTKDAFVHPAEFHRSKVYVPQAVVDFVQADVLASERVRDADPLVLPANAAVATDETDLEVAGVLDGCELPWKRATRGSIDRSNEPLSDNFV